MDQAVSQQSYNFWYHFQYNTYFLYSNQYSLDATKIHSLTTSYLLESSYGLVVNSILISIALIIVPCKFYDYQVTINFYHSWPHPSSYCLIVINSKYCYALHHSFTQSSCIYPLILLISTYSTYTAVRNHSLTSIALSFFVLMLPSSFSS